MKRLLTYLFLVLGLGLVVSVNANEKDISGTTKMLFCDGVGNYAQNFIDKYSKKIIGSIYNFSENDFQILVLEKENFRKSQFLGIWGQIYLIWAYQTMLCTNHCFNNTLSKNDGLTVFESSLEAKWDPLGDRKEKYQKISIFGSLRSRTVCILGPECREW